MRVSLPLTALLPCLIALSVPAQAQDFGKNTPRPGGGQGGITAAPLPPPMSADAFDAKTVGRVMEHYVDGGWYGAEEYFPDHKVIWADPTGCMHGTWEERDGLICFHYADGNPDRCWHYTDSGPGIDAHFEGNPLSSLVSLIDEGKKLQCPPDEPNA